MEQNSDSTTYNKQRLTDMVNEVSQEIFTGKVSNELTGKVIELNTFAGIEDKFAVNIIGSIAIGGDITTASVEILMDTTNLPTTWAIMLGNEVIEYTGKEATKITGCTWILSSHKSGDIATVLYKCPADFYKTTKVYTFLSNKELEIAIKDNINNMYKYYYIVDGATAKYIVFQWVITADPIYIKYKKEYTYLTDDTDVCVFDKNTALNIISFICGGRMIKDEILRVKLLNQWYNKLVVESAKQGEDTGKANGIGWKRFGFNSIR